MPWRRRRVVEVEAGPPPPLPQSNPWPWLILLLVLVGFGVAGLWLWLDDRNQGETKTVIIETVVATAAPRRVSVPAVVGQGQVDAGDTIEAAGLRADSYAVTSAELRGMVVSQAPAAGEKADAPSTVRLDVSLGSGARASKAVPDVAGSRESDARATARAAGFTVRTVDRRAPRQDQRGEVLTQNPAAGSRAPELTQMSIFVGR